MQVGFARVIWAEYIAPYSIAGDGLRTRGCPGPAILNVFNHSGSDPVRRFPGGAFLQQSQNGGSASCLYCVRCVIHFLEEQFETAVVKIILPGLPYFDAQGLSEWKMELLLYCLVLNVSPN